MDEEAVATFCAITAGTPQQAQTYLEFSNGNMEQAIELFYNSPDLAPAPRTTAPPTTRNPEDPITIDSDDDDEGPSAEDDEAMARRLQQEMYGAGGGGGAGGDFDEDGVRAPMARTTETLVGPDSNWRDDPSEMNVAVMEQMRRLQQRRNLGGAPGIFNQRETASIWANDSTADPESRRRELSRATGGASEQSSKSTLLADLFRPPFDLISPLPFSAARDEGKDTEKWILVNVQDASIFDCQVLNRDIWKNESIKETIKEHFIFLQYPKEDPRGQEYINYYFSAMRDHDDAYPHIAIVDPRTGEQVKTWSGSPGPKASDFLMDLHEFLDRYSLKMERKNPVQAKRKDKKKDIAQMSEEEMLQMAMQNSVATSSTQKEEDPDALTKASDSTSTAGPSGADAMDTDDAEANQSNGKTETATKDTPFSRISATSPHEEPTSTDPKETTRVQFRYSGGRVVRRFSINDSVSRIYEWLKASPFDEHAGQDFELISMGKNLIDVLESSIAEAGLKNGTVMVEFIENE
jgi:thioredoxin-related protein